MKKVVSILAVAVLMISVLSITAFAYGGRMRQQPQYELCTVDGCDLAGLHQHDNSWYCSQTGLQNSYEICTVDDCTQFGLHEHDGTYYRAFRNGGRGGCCWR